MHTLTPAQSNARIAPLAVLPVFFTLAGRRAVAIGGGEPVTWKVELLAATGAHVDVYTDAPGEELLALSQRPPAAGTIALHARQWLEADLADAAIAVAEIDDDLAARDFVSAARRIGVPYNVIDRPEFCQFQFGGIVNRSPVVIGISTAGAAPILGQAVRRRIETLLPDSLRHWAEFAEEVRSTIMAKLPSKQQRRAFWERFAEKAFGGRPPEPSDLDLAIPEAGGRVTLVGAGPGDAELLTIKAVRALQSADVILFDDLVSSDVLELARREAKRMLVGKRAERPSCAQDEINALMLSLARQGKHVVRLKSGDPMIFGRAGEEIEMLERNNIPVAVVPGISAGIALASRLGLSLTHRDLAQSVQFVTGHSRNGGLPPNLDWRALAAKATTSIYYMSRRTLPKIVDELIAADMDPATPCVIAADIGRATERLWRGALTDSPAAATDFAETAPTIFAVGRCLSTDHMSTATGDASPEAALEAPPYGSLISNAPHLHRFAKN